MAPNEGSRAGSSPCDPSLSAMCEAVEPKLREKESNMVRPNRRNNQSVNVTRLGETTSAAGSTRGDPSLNRKRRLQANQPPPVRLVALPVPSQTEQTSPEGDAPAPRHSGQSVASGCCSEAGSAGSEG